MELLVLEMLQIKVVCKSRKSRVKALGLVRVTSLAQELPVHQLPSAPAEGELGVAYTTDQ